MVEATGFSYTGRYTDYAIVDERQPVSETVVYVGIKRPCGGEDNSVHLKVILVCEIHGGHIH
jgi:hypothetical protein